MAIPPIIANNPVFKLFQSDKTQNKDSRKADDSAAASAGSSPQDVVNISEAARKKLESVQQKVADTDTQARRIAGETKGILEKEIGRAHV